jgi:hypothetical protein
MLAMSVTQFEEALVKTVGAFVTTFIAVVVLRRFLLPPLLNILGPAGQPKIWHQAAR